MTLQGLRYLIQYIIDLSSGTPLKFGTHLVNSNYNIIGIVLGLWFIVTGIGIWYRKKYAYNSTIIVQSLLIIYVLLGLCYLLITQGFSLAPVVILIIELIIFFIVIKYTQRNKSYFI